ncbi:MAG: ABC transporter permease [Planctomycetes bacterium]|nr:ABC transporter permease [Planctomycetota bacterium]
MRTTREPTVIARRRRWSLGLFELWRHRELVWFLAVRDVKVRYKQTVFGVGWAVLQPALGMAVFALVIGRLAGLDHTTGSVPYPLYAFVALLPWQLFARGLTEGSTSLITNRNLITKVYFPRAAIPLAPVAAAVIDFACAFGVLVPAMLLMGVQPGGSLLLVPVALAGACAVAAAVSLCLSAVVTVLKDVRHTLPLVSQLWLFLSPVAYPAVIVPERWHAVYGLNPMAGVIELFRWAVFADAPPSFPIVASSAIVTVLALGGGLLLFHRLEPRFADTV